MAGRDPTVRGGCRQPLPSLVVNRSLDWRSAAPPWACRHLRHRGGPHGRELVAPAADELGHPSRFRAVCGLVVVCPAVVVGELLAAPVGRRPTIVRGMPSSSHDIFSSTRFRRLVWVLGGRPVLRDRRAPVARGSKPRADPPKPTERAENGAAGSAITLASVPWGSARDRGGVNRERRGRGDTRPPRSRQPIPSAEGLGRPLVAPLAASLPTPRRGALTAFSPAARILRVRETQILSCETQARVGERIRCPLGSLRQPSGEKVERDARRRW